MKKKKIAGLVLAASLMATTLVGCGGESTSNAKGTDSDSSESGKTIELTNVSYDPTRELYAAYDRDG